MGAAFLCALSGTDLPVLENQGAYIAGWLRHIRNGSAADVIQAVVDAQQAVDYRTGGGDGPTPSSPVPEPGETPCSQARVGASPCLSIGFLHLFDAPTRSQARVVAAVQPLRRYVRGWNLLLLAVWRIIDIQSG